MRRWLGASLYGLLGLFTLATGALIAAGGEWPGAAVFIGGGVLLGLRAWASWRAVPSRPAAPAPTGLAKPIGWGIALVVLDVAIGGGTALFSIFAVFGMATIGLVWALARFRDRHVMLSRLRALAIAGAMAGATIGWGAFDGARAERRVLATAAALDAYQARHGQYPDALGDLVPGFLAEPPHAHTFGMARRLMYGKNGPNGPWLMYIAVPPFGRRVLDVNTGVWTVLD